MSEWLDLSRYDGAKEFGAYQWGMQFRARASLLKDLEKGEFPQFHGKHCDDVKTDPLTLGSRNAMIPGPNSAPIRDLGHLDMPILRSAFEIEEVTEAVSEWEKGYAPDWRVRFLNAVFVAGHGSSLGKNALYGVQMHPFLLSMIAEGVNVDEEGGCVAASDEECKQAIAFVEAMTSGAFIRVNLELDDKILLSHFEKWLKERRELCAASGMEHLAQAAKRTGGNRSGRLKLLPGDGLRWHKMMLLPYTDIRICAKYEKRKMPSSASIAEYVFQEERDEAYVRNEVAPEARRLLRRENYLQLLDQGVWGLLASK